MTLPPAQFFSGCDFAIARDHVVALRQLGAAVCEYDTTPVYRTYRKKGVAGLQQQVDDLRRFRPDAVIGAPHAGYAIQPFTALGTATIRTRFRETCFWTIWICRRSCTGTTHSFNSPDTRFLSSRPALRTRELVLFGRCAHPSAPRAFHFFPDTGQIAELRRLGIGEFPADASYIAGISHQYVDYGRAPDSPGGEKAGVAFFGNIYAAAAQRITYTHEALFRIRRQALATLDADWDRAPELVTINQLVDIVERIAGVSLKRRYKLDAPKGVRGRNSDLRLERREMSGSR